LRLLQVRYAKEGRVLNVKFIDEDIGISSTSTGNLRVWSLRDDRLIQSITTSDPLPAIALTADERMAALGHQGVIELYDMGVDNTVVQINIEEGEVTALAFDQNGSKLLSATQSGHSLSPVIKLSLWDTQTREEILSFNGHTNRIHRLEFSPDGSTFLSASDDKQVILWDVLTGEVRFRFASPTDTGNAVTFSPDGRWMAAGFGTFRFVAGGEYLDNSVRLWDIEKGLELNRFEGHEDAVVSIAFSPDGRYLLSGSIDTTLLLWDISMGKMVHRLLGHASGVMSVAFSPDGRYAVSGSQDGMLMVWDLENGDLVRQIKGHQGVVHLVAFTQDGESIWSASEDGQIKLWNPIFSLDNLFSWINENRFVPELSCEQGLLYGLVKTCNE
jgi:WD40 repeat protein